MATSYIIGDIVLGPFINDIVVSGFAAVASYPVVSAILKAHPSNSGILYIRARSATSGFGFPLNGGERLELANVDLYQFTVSGVVGQRLAYSLQK